MTAKEILAKVRALFDVNPAPPAVADPTAPAPTSTATTYSYPVDGGGTVYVDCSDDGIADIDVNDKVYSDATKTAPYADGTYTVTGTQFGFTVVGGIVTAVNDVAGTGPGTPLEDAMAKPPATPPAPPAAPPAPAAPITTPKFEMTPEGAAAMFAAFATGSSDDRIANLELVCKALMEYNFGWQIREAQQKQTADAAILVYKQDLVTAQAALAKQDGQLKGLFELMEKLAEVPTADPVTLTGPKKEKFDKAQAKEDKFQKIADSIKQMREEKNK